MRIKYTPDLPDKWELVDDMIEEVEIKLDKSSTVLGVSILPVTEADAFQEDRLYKGVPDVTGKPSDVIEAAKSLRSRSLPEGSKDPEPRVLVFFVSDASGRFFSISPIDEILVFALALASVADDASIFYDKTFDGRFIARHGTGVLR